MTDPIYIELVLKNVIKLAKGSLIHIFQDSFNIILFQQLTHNRSYPIEHIVTTITFSFTETVFISSYLPSYMCDWIFRFTFFVLLSIISCQQNI